MARTRTQPALSRKTRSRPNISYAEDSHSESDLEAVDTDEEGSVAEVFSPATRRLTRSSHPQSPVDNADADAESDTAVSEDGTFEKVHLRTPRRVTRASQRTRPSPASKRHRRRFHESPEDDSDCKTTPKRRKVGTPGKARATPSRARGTPARMRASSLKQASPSKSNSPSNKAAVIPSSGVIPSWQVLPYQVLVRIFQYAAYPLYDDEKNFQPLPSLQWLLDVALMCRAFAEPAATVLYANPPLVPMTMAHGLMRLLRADPSDHKFGYRQKVETLKIDVYQVAAYSLGGSGHLDLFSLIKDLPRLKKLEFYHNFDMSPYRTLDQTIKWNYPEEIFRALEYVDPAAHGKRGDKLHIRTLESWRWSARLAGKKYPVERIATLHLKTYFQSLRKLAFVNYQAVEVREGEEDPDHELCVATAVNALPQLEHLIFESCTLVNGRLLSLLPTGLQRLELINCIDVVSDAFTEFLLTHGRKLQVLVLNHNRALDLNFLPVLGEACPSLQVFRMNLTFFNIHSTYRDSEPLYDELLVADQVPVWPTTLQVIELIQLRQWSTEAAETLFDSLLDSAEVLPDLRKLTIQAILNIAWRDRAAFRDKWVGSLEQVFKRVSADPLPVHTLPPPIPGLKAESPVVIDDDDDEEDIKPQTPKRKSRRNTGSQGSSSSKMHLTLPERSREKRVVASSGPRTFRSTTRTATAGKYAESDSSDIEEITPASSSDFEELDEPEKPVSPKISARAKARQATFNRELEILKQTAGFASTPPAITSESSADDSGPSFPKKNKKGKGKQASQGMCDIVEIRIDNLRPTEKQVTEADFLDEERSGDEDWVS